MTLTRSVEDMDGPTCRSSEKAPLAPSCPDINQDCHDRAHRRVGTRDRQLWHFQRLLFKLNYSNLVTNIDALNGRASVECECSRRGEAERTRICRTVNEHIVSTGKGTFLHCMSILRASGRRQKSYLDLIWAKLNSAG